jgi:glycosyltransferase involved in cell wall biosynthesis
VRILDVSPRVVHPPTRGSSVRAANLLRVLAERHEMRQLSQARLRRRGDPEGARGRFAVTPSYVELRMAAPVPTIATELGARSWVRAPVLSGVGLGPSPRLRAQVAWADVVLVEFPWQFAACRRARSDVPIVLAGCNVEAAKFADYAAAAGSPRTAPIWLRAVERLERRAVQGADLVLAVSDADRDELIRRYAPPSHRVVTIPNGADTTRYRPSPPEARRAARARLGLPDRPTVLFAGADVPPNRAGLAWVRRLAAQAPHLTFLVTGAVAPPSSDAVVATGLLDDFGIALVAADFALCPIEFGGGTKIKLLEGLAAGLPTVAFGEALHGLDLDGEVLVAPKSEDGLLSALDRLSDPAVARELSQRGRDWVVARYDWRAIARLLEVQLEDLVARRGRAQAAAVGSGSGSGSVSEPTTSYTSS